MEAGSRVTQNKNQATAGHGGGVDVPSGGVFNLNGGTIDYNIGFDGGGVSLSGGEMYMTSGFIENNRAEFDTGNPDGGGVLADGGSYFVMSGGEIRNNYAKRYGGGVHVYSGGSGSLFEMSGGSIHDNTADNSGGGVHVWRGTFDMTGGFIYSNKAVTTGGVHRYDAANSFITLPPGWDPTNIYSNTLMDGTTPSNLNWTP
jgi:hypothetical protein